MALPWQTLWVPVLCVLARAYLTSSKRPGGSLFTLCEISMCLLY